MQLVHNVYCDCPRTCFIKIGNIIAIGIDVLPKLVIPFLEKLGLPQIDDSLLLGLKERL